MAQQKMKTGLARCLELASDHRGLVFLSGFLAALAAICSFAPYVSIYYIIREILMVYPDLSRLDVPAVTRWSWLALAGIFGNIVLYFFALLASHVAAFGTLYELKIAFAEHIMQMPLGYHLTIGSGKLRKIMDENIESIEQFIAHQLPDFVASLVAPLVLIVILLGVDWRYGVVCLAGIVLAFAVQLAGFNGRAREKMQRFQRAQENMNAASVEYVRGMSEIKAFNQTAASFKRLSTSIKDYTTFVLDYALGWQNAMPAFTTIIHNIYLLLIPVGIWLSARTTDMRQFALTFIFYLIIVHAISGILNKIMYISESFTQISGSVARMDEILRIPAMPEQTAPVAIETFDVRFEDVSFSYDEDGGTQALSHLSFQAAPGRVTAIVGPSGGGKSTIASLVSRFYDVSAGSIQIGGVDIRQMPLDALMAKVSFVYQDTFLFKQRIFDNIRIGNPDATEAQVVAAAKAAQCHDFIMRLPDGYDTVIGAHGVHLSGGERQRIAIARAIVKDAPIIVLDEATAFSDPENEYLIQKAFETLTADKTVIMIAHRLSTIRRADQILVMNQGKLVESGSHDALLARGGKYAEMWASYTASMHWKISTGRGM
ncbi:MAG: ABC transporter ATP-binding protein [Peptococcaceae bacterium]|nr:ABC transporter ATP-binding protein [Peptococcaceae bacterium]